MRIPLIALLCSLSIPALAETAPDFSLRNLENKEVKLSDYRGSVVLVNFWATWCVPCQVEMPHLETMYSELQDQGFVVLAISADDARSKSRVKPLVKSKGYTFPVLLDTETQVVTQYNPQKILPYTVLVDREGELVYRHQGYNTGDEVEMREQIEALLGGGAAPDDGAAPEPDAPSDDGPAPEPDAPEDAETPTP